jgi:hypothetical protein
VNEITSPAQAQSDIMHCPAAFNAPRSSPFWRRLTASCLEMAIARAMQAFVENIPRRDTRLAHDSIASVVCLMETMKA